MSETVNKKVLRIKNGEFLLGVNDNSIATTYKLTDAMDISSWSLKQIEYIISNLHKVGYTKAQVLDIVDGKVKNK